MLNITMPCLLFSKIVPAFTSQNIGALGPLITIGCIYQGLGLFMALIIREFFWVPHRFRNGLLAAGIWANYGDVPTAVIMSVTSAAPFSPEDSNLGVAYVSAFILVFFITLFPMGGHHLIAMDFEGPDKEDDEVKEELQTRKRKRIMLLQNCLRSFKLSSSKTIDDVENSPTTPIEDGRELKKEANQSECVTQVVPDRASLDELASERRHHRRQVTFDPLVRANTLTGEVSEKANVSRAASTYAGQDVLSPTPTMIAPTERDFDTGNAKMTNEKDGELVSSSRNPTSPSRRAWNVFRSLISPATISMFLSFPIALVTPLKGLFVHLDNSPIPSAPDGQPPLYFIFDTANFLGAASIPLGLICLGAALAKLKVPKTWNSLPLGAIGWMAIGKLVVSPILGILIVNAFMKIGFIHEEDKVLRFVTMFFSCMPTATTQVFLTQVYSGTGEAEHLSAFLIPQYALMLVSTTALTAYSLHTIF